MLYQFVKILSKTINILPMAVRHSIGRGLGLVFWWIIPAKRRNMAIGNIRRSLNLDESQATLIAKRSTTRFGKMVIDMLYMSNFTPETIQKYVKLEGHEHLTEALSHGKGAIVATSHSGNWELFGAALAMYGFPLVSVAQKQTNSDMDHFINELRTKSGMEVIYKTGVRDMVKILGQGRVVGILMDQDAGPEGVMVEFFGRLSSTPQGAAALGRLKDSPIVPIFITENDDGTHTGTLYPAMWVEKTQDREQDILIMTQKLTTIIEEHIRSHPHEWFWLHNRWKNTPPVE